tara:strand:- start:3737 stop:4039 length:303 start_codon:yes stop_codon:yes gene_type:complete
LQKGYRLAKKQKINLISFILGLFLCTILCIGTIAVNARCNELTVEINDLSRNLTYNRNEVTNLESKITYLSRREHIERIAKEKLELVGAILEPMEIVLTD